MKDLYELKYGDAMLPVLEKDNTYMIKLPDRADENGRGVYQEIITLREDGMYFHRRNSRKFVNATQVILKRDGTIQYYDDEIHDDSQILTAPYKFNPRAKNDEYPYNVAKDMYELQEQLATIIKLKDAIKRYRQTKLRIYLEMLGYSDPKEVIPKGAAIEGKVPELEVPRDYTGYCDLNEIGRDLDDYINWPSLEGFSYRVDRINERDKKDGTKEKNVDRYTIYREPTEAAEKRIKAYLTERGVDLEMARIQQKDFADIFDALTIKLEEEHFLRQEHLPRKRYFDEEFYVGIPSKISKTETEWKEFEEETLQDAETALENRILPKDPPKQKVILNSRFWRTYSEQIPKLAALLVRLNADLLDEDLLKKPEEIVEEEQRSENAKKFEDYTTLSRIKNGDKVGDVIDDISFEEATHIENIFVTAEDLRILRRIKELRGDYLPDAEKLDISGSFAESFSELELSTIQDITNRKNSAEKYLQKRKDMKTMGKGVKILYKDTNKEER